MEPRARERHRWENREVEVGGSPRLNVGSKRVSKPFLRPTCRTYTDSNSSAVVFKFGVRLDKWSISTPTTSFFSL